MSKPATSRRRCRSKFIHFDRPCACLGVPARSEGHRGVEGKPHEGTCSWEYHNGYSLMGVTCGCAFILLMIGTRARRIMLYRGFCLGELVPSKCCAMQTPPFHSVLIACMPDCVRALLPNVAGHDVSGIRQQLREAIRLPRRP